MKNSLKNPNGNSSQFCLTHSLLEGRGVEMGKKGELFKSKFTTMFFIIKLAYNIQFAPGEKNLVPLRHIKFQWLYKLFGLQM